jgi:tetratricopeptide (TPR) repeat protein
MDAGDVIDGRFAIERVIGAGGMGQVYLAQDELSGEPVAVKVLIHSGSEDLQRFAREAQALALMRVPGVVRYIAHGATDTGEPYLAMEWLAGETLSERLNRKPLTVAESAELVKRVATTLSGLHQLGVVHRDIKPSNLMLVGGAIERVMLLDFGVARIGGELQLTVAGAILGTPGYMAPEQARGQLRIDAHADIFALGCVLYKCLTGRAPFQAASVLAVLAKVLLEDPPRVRKLREDIPDALDSLVSRMLGKAPENRPDAGAVAEELSWLAPLAAGPPSAGPPSVERLTALTTSERKVMCLVLARSAADADVTRIHTPDQRQEAALRALAERHHGKLELIDARTPLVVLSGALAPTDLAVRAAHCALSMQALLGNAPVVLVTGRAELAESLPVGELIDRAVQMLPPPNAPTSGPGVVIDEVTERLMGTRFVCTEAAGRRTLHMPAEDLTTQPKLLGRTMPFVGRDREIGLLMSQLELCLDEPASTYALVTGPSGMGKSRLRHELLSRVKARGEATTIWAGQADPISAGSAFGLLSKAVRRGLDIAEGEPIETRRDKLRTRVAQHRALDAARVSAFLGELVGAPFPDDEDVQLRAARRNPMLMNDQIRLAWEEFLHAECAALPVLIVIEDLHWGDLPTVTMIDGALRALKDRPFMVLAFGRPEVHDLFPKLWEGRHGQKIALTALTRRASERLVRQALGASAGDKRIAKLVERADGNAFYLEELIRAAMTDEDAALPETVLAMVQARLEALSLDARRVLRAASIFGQSFWQNGVAALVGAAEAASELVQLEHREIIVRQGTGHRTGDVEYRFGHALVREAAYGMLTERDRRAGHALAGDWLDQTGDADPMGLAEHFDRGGEPVRAAKAYLRAAEQALCGSDLSAAIERAERGMAFGPAKETAGALRLVQAEAHLWRGELAHAEARGAEASELLPVGSARWFLTLTHVISACGKLGAADRIDRWSGVVRDAAIAEGALGARTACLSRTANTMVFRGDYASADALLEAIEQPRSGADASDPDALAQLYQARAFRSVLVGDSEASLRNFKDVLAAFEHAGDRRNACSARVNLACLLVELGDYPGAETLLRAALAAAEQMQLHEPVAAIQNNLGHALAYAGKLDEARVVEGAALEATLRMGIPRMTGSALTYLAKIALFAGDFTTAEREARAAADALEIAPPLRPLSVAVLAQALLGLGRADEAREAACEAHSAIETLGGVEEGESLIRLTYAEALAAAGREAEAEKAITAAEAALMARAARFHDPRWRDSFLDNVPEHARTRELARQWSVRARR